MILDARKLSVMEEFMGDYSVKLTGSEIAKRKGLNQKSVSNLLKGLEKEGFLRYDIQGKNLLYSLNLRDELAITSFISCVEHLRTIAFFRKKLIVKEIIRHTPLIGIIAIFGSYAKGLERKGSDLDVCVIGECNVEEVEKLSEIYQIDIKIMHYKAAPDRPDPLLVEVLKDHIIVSGVQGFVQLALKWKKFGGASV